MSFLVAGVEGWVDKAVLEKILVTKGLKCERIQDFGGSSKLDAAIPRFLQMTRSHGVCILRDQDAARCAPELLRRFGVDNVANPDNLVFRVPVRQIEAWLLADSEGFPRYFKVAKAQVPSRPDDLADAKEEVLRLVRRSTSPTVREGMLPRAGYSNRTGPEYASMLMAFATDRWDPERARGSSPSLERALRAFASFKARN